LNLKLVINFFDDVEEIIDNLSPLLPLVASFFLSFHFLLFFGCEWNSKKVKLFHVVVILAHVACLSIRNEINFIDLIVTCARTGLVKSLLDSKLL